MKQELRATKRVYESFLTDLYKQGICDLRGMVRFLMMQYRGLSLEESKKIVREWYLYFIKNTNEVIDRKQLLGN